MGYNTSRSAKWVMDNERKTTAVGPRSRWWIDRSWLTAVTWDELFRSLQ